MGYIKKLKNNELVGGTDKTTIYPVTSTEAVFEEVIEDGESNFKSQKFLNNNITGDRINEGTITDYNIATGTITKGKLTPQVQTMLDEGQKKALTPKGNYNLETEYEALDLVFDPVTNSSYISLVTPNVGHPVDENAEGYEEGWWEKTLDGTAVNTAQAAIDAKVGQLETQVGTAITQAETAVDEAKQETLNAYTQAEALAQQITDWSSSEISSIPSYTDQHPLSNRASSAQIGYFECGTSSATQASNQIKAVTAGGYALPTSGGAVKIKMYAANTYTPTTNNPVKLQFNADATTLKELRYNNEPVSADNTWDAGEVISVYFDGTNYQASNAKGGSNRRVDNYIYGDIKTFSVGQSYDLHEPVKTTSKDLLRLTTEIKPMNITDAVTIGELKTYGTGANASTYKAQKSVDVYDGTEVEGLYAIGRPAVYTITINADGLSIKEDTEITVTINGNAQTIVVTPDASETKAADIASLISDAFLAIDGWVLSDNENGTLSLKCETLGENTVTITSSVGSTGLIITSSLTVGSKTLSKYTEGVWVAVTLANYAADSANIGETDISKMWQKISTQELLDYTEPNSIQKDIRDKIEEDEYVLIMNRLKQDKELEDVEYVVARAVGDHERRINNLEDNGGSGDGGNSSLSGFITTSTSDTICVIGSSFGVGYTISGKHWVNIVSMFSDYSVQNLSADGSSNLTRLQALRNGTITPAAKAKYALLVNSENFGGGQTALLRSFVNLAKVIMSYGITPICGTSYRPADGVRQMHFYFCSLLRNWCKQNNTIFMDAAQYRLIVGDGYNFEKPGNTHLGTRQIPLVAYAYMDALSGLERPFQSLKTFTKRNEVFVNDLDDLMFSDNYGRAKVFKEATSYKDYALISAILPATTKNLNSIKLSFGTTSNVKVYVINTIAKPFPSAPTYTRFHIDSVLTTNPEVGDIYTYGDKQFTVVKVETEEDQHYGAYCDIYCDPPLPPSEEEVSGTLAKVSGNGDSEIVFSSYGIATLASGDAAIVDADTIGHWELVEPDEEGGSAYTISDLIAKVSIDKINFLVECEGSFSLSNIRVAWDATALKTNYQRTPKDDFTTNVWNSNAEIITEPTFGAVGTSLTTWKDENGEAVVSEATYEHTLTGQLYTPGGQAVIKVGLTHYAQTVVNKSSLKVGKIVIEVIARFFGDGITTGFVDGSETVNSDTFDWAQLTVMVGGDELNYGNPTYGNYVYPIGLYWRIIRIPIDILGSERFNMRLRLFADRNGVEIAKVSLKYI